MSKEVTKKETGAMTIPDAFKKKGPSASVIDQKDMLIPRLLIMQPTSDFVTKGTASMGDIMSSVTEEKVGDRKAPVKFIPLITYKTVEYYDATGPKPRFLRREPWDAKKHASVEWEQVIDGVKNKVMECLNFYIFLEKDLNNPMGMPHLAKFSSKAYRPAKKLLGHFMQMEMIEAEPWFGMLEMTVNIEKNDKGTFAVPDFKPVGQTDAKYAAKIQKWVDIISRNAVKIDETDDEIEPETRTVGRTVNEAQAQF